MGQAEGRRPRGGRAVVGWKRPAVRALCLALGLGGLRIWVSTAAAQDLNYQVAGQLEGYYDSKWKETVLDNRLDAMVSHGPYALGASFISHSPSDFTRLDPNNFGPEIQGVRKRWLEARTENWDLRVGDSYATFGRGLALQIFEDQTVDFDNAIDGAAGRAAFGPAEIKFLAGTNSFGPAAQVLKAAHLGFALPAGFRAGAHGVWSDNLSGLSDARTGGDRLYGGLLGGSLGRVDLYGEYVLRDQRNAQGGPAQRVQEGNAAIPEGHAGYANVNLNLGRVQVMAEYKDLLRYNLPQIPREDGTLQPFVNPPTALRQHNTTLLNRATHVANIRLDDERGGLVETYINLAERTQATGSFSRSESRHGKNYRDLGLLYRTNNFQAWEAYGELEHWLGEHLEVVLRADESEETIEEGGLPLFFERRTWGGTLAFPIVEKWSGDFTAENQAVQESNKSLREEEFLFHEYTNTLGTLTVSRSPNMAWAVTAEWTDDERQEDQTWVWGEWNLRLGERHQLLLGGGRLRGGQVCSGGVCKLVDPFEGGRIELLTTF